MSGPLLLFIVVRQGKDLNRPQIATQLIRGEPLLTLPKFHLSVSIFLSKDLSPFLRLDPFGHFLSQLTSLAVRSSILLHFSHRELRHFPYQCRQASSGIVGH
ncbi:hypothetical protein J1N35_005446 [Gossypium stocksii]|uniref:Uncharacterized protein n=1 Tax=Gossypium stocksii TaxID=47602 RepID=A0A9D4AJ98_9ROSI|nr:hypothetical protein J1N35_005446 [Gossypium stocksii]